MRCNIFLGYISNLISSGLREVILHLVKHKHVACIVTTAGGIGKTYLADFSLDSVDLRRDGGWGSSIAIHTQGYIASWKGGRPSVR